MKKLYLCLILSLSLSCANGLDDMFDDLGMKVPICVNSSAPAGGDGRGWGRAFNNIQDAVNAADSGDEIWVAGTQNILSTVVINKPVSLYGGFTGAESRRDDRSGTKTLINGSLPQLLSITSSNMTLDSFVFNCGGSSGRALLIQNSDAIIKNSDFLQNNCPAVGGAISFKDGVLEVIGCDFVRNSSSVHGGAIYSFNDASKNVVITIANSNFKGNSAITFGGACYFENVDSLKITGSTFGVKGSTDINDKNRSNDQGGAVYLKVVNAEILNSNFYGNESAYSSEAGGAIYAMYSLMNLTIDNCEIMYNKATAGSGGAVSSGCNTIIKNSLIIGNNSNINGGGLFFLSAGRYFNISNCTISGNTAVRSGGGAYSQVAINQTISDSIITDNTAGNLYSGGGLYQSSGTLQITNSLVSDNICNGSSQIDVRSSITSFVAINSSFITGAGSSLGYFETGNFTNCIFYGGSINRTGSTFSFSGTNIAGIVGVEVINTITTADFTNFASKDYTLSSSSSLKNEGDNAATAGYTTDLVGNPRIVGGIVDIGCYEIQ